MVFGCALLWCVALAAGCASPAADGEPAEAAQTVVTYWRHHHRPEVDAIRKLIDAFERRHPGIRIDLRTFPYGVFRTKAVATLAAGKGPDLINIHNSWAHGYIVSGLLVPVPDGVFAKGELQRDFFPMLRSFCHHGLCYGVPIGGSNLGLLINRTLFKRAGLDPDRPPRTWKAFAAAAKKLTRFDDSGRMVQVGAAFGRAEDQGWNFFIDGVMRQFGSEVLSSDQKRVMWDNEKGVRALTWYTDFVRVHRVNSILMPKGNEAFRLKLAAMNIAGAWQVAYLNTVGADMRVTTAEVPHFAGGPRATFGTFWGNAVTRKASAPVRKAAFSFVKFISRYDNMRKWTEWTRELPMRKRVLQDTELMSRFPLMAPFIRQMAHSHASVKKDEGVYKAAVVDMVDEVLLRDTPAREALSRAAKKINAMLGSR